MLFANACGGSSPTTASNSATGTCNVADQNSQVLAIMQSWYYWFQSLPASVNLASFSTTDALLNALREQPLDRFTYITTQSADQSFYGAGQYVGFGLGFALSAANNLIVNQVFPGSPANQAGIVRGDTVTAVNGQTVPNLVANNQLDSALNAATPGVNISFTYTDLPGASHTVELTSAVITQPSVSQVSVLNAGGQQVGYFLFNSFIDPSTGELDQAFSQFASQGVTQLVIDERYNGGGEISVAQHLASLIAGNSYAGKTLTTLTYNTQHTDQNTTVPFQTVTGALNLSQIAFITSDATASASELIINSLTPYLHVVTVGSATFGKPVGEDGFNVCTNVLYPITFKIENVSGYGDYFDGLPPTCPAADDVTHGLGDPDEASLATALNLVRTGSCGPSAAAPGAAEREAARPRRVARYGFRQLVNAY
jgi:carboxyl-terminal processing protease